MRAIDQARMLYVEHSRDDFDKILAEHLHDGIVISSPMWFMMLRAEKWEQGMVWFIECAVGNLGELARAIAIELPYIAFCRVKNGKKQTKIYPANRLLRLAQREIKK